MKNIIKGFAIVLATLSFACLGGCVQEKSEKITIYMPDGAPAMAFAKLMEEEDSISYKVVNPTVIATKVTNKDEEKNADVCVLPITAASKLLGEGNRYQALSLVTKGNLYLISKDTALSSAFEEGEYKDITYLIGKTVGVMKINDMPGLTFKWILQNYGLSYAEIGNDGFLQADKVNLKGITDATAINPADSSVSCYVVAEPAASVQIEKKGFSSVCSLESLYYKGELPAQGFDGYPQAVMVAKRSLIQENPTFIKTIMEKVETSVKALPTMTGGEIVESVTTKLEDKNYATTLKAAVLKKEVVARCGVCFSNVKDCKQVILEYLENIQKIDDKVQIANEEFFYIG